MQHEAAEYANMSYGQDTCFNPLCMDVLLLLEFVRIGICLDDREHNARQSATLALSAL